MTVPRPALYGAVAALAVALGVITALSYFGRDTLQLQTATLLPQPRALPEFVLTDHHGQPFTRTSLAGHWSVLFAGFATCPDVCPTTLALLRKVQDRLAAQNLSLRVLFLSVDPDRDTAERLKAYVEHFGPAFVGITAPEPELGRVAQAMGIAYARVPGEAGAYTVDHSAALILVNPRAEIAAYFLPPHDLEKFSDDLARVLGAES